MERRLYCKNNWECEIRYDPAQQHVILPKTDFNLHKDLITETESRYKCDVLDMFNNLSERKKMLHKTNKEATIKSKEEIGCSHLEQLNLLKKLVNNKK
ncbi:MAG: hypothetical protein AABX88_02845 [Nanoarchaeota archaeon]